MLALLYIVYIFFCLFGLKFLIGKYNPKYLSKEQCNAVKGFFIVLVFFSHINQYIYKSGFDPLTFGDIIYFRLTKAIGQLMVTMFLFISGYGIMESYKKKGIAYIKTMPKRRILITLLNFDVAVLCFVALNIFLGNKLSFTKVMLSLIAWDSVGNSNWYIFCILLCYLLAFIVFYFYEKYLPKDNKKYIPVLVTLFILTISTIIILSYYKQPWWYNTMLCFPFGMLYSTMKEKMEVVIQKHYYICFLLLILLFIVARYTPFSMKGLTYNIESIFFVMIVILFMMRTKLNNKYLQWMGQKLFPLYIYQRLIMMAIYEIPGGKSFIMSYPILYVIICFGCTLLIASQYHRWQITLTSK